MSPHVDEARLRPLLIGGARGADTVADRAPLPWWIALQAVARCVLRTAAMLARREIAQPTDHLGQVLRFDDGSHGQVYRETVVPSARSDDGAVLVVAFRLRWVRGWGHALFRAESLLNTPLFVGFPGFVSKLWLAADENGVYRGVYQWNGSASADAYARALWWVLALVSERSSIHYVVLPGAHRDALLASPVQARKVPNPAGPRPLPGRPLLDAEALHQTATSQPFGWRYDVATAVTEPLVDVSRALHLTEPRHWIEDLFDRPSTRPLTQPTPPTALPPSTTSTSVASTTTEPGSPTTASTTTTTIPPSALRTPTAADPLRVLIAGDSMTEAAGPALVDALAATGVVDVDRELRYSSGLTRPDYFDWPARLRQLAAEQRAEAIVLWVGANDAQGIQTPDGPASFGTEAWVTEYRGRVAALMDELTQDGRIVYWLGEPIMRSADFDERMRLITRIYGEEAESRPGVRFVGTRELFSDANGSYSAYLPGSDGDPVLVRRDDGIHLTEAGADRLVPAVMAAMRRDVRLP